MYIINKDSQNIAILEIRNDKLANKGTVSLVSEIYSCIWHYRNTLKIGYSMMSLLSKKQFSTNKIIKMIIIA